MISRNPRLLFLRGLLLGLIVGAVILLLAMNKPEPLIEDQADPILIEESVLQIVTQTEKNVQIVTQSENIIEGTSELQAHPIPEPGLSDAEKQAVLLQIWPDMSGVPPQTPREGSIHPYSILR